MNFVFSPPSTLANLENEAFEIYLTCYQLLDALQDPRASHILQTAYMQLQERAGKISDAELRQSFLQNVKVHRTLIHLYQSQLCPS